MAIRNDRGKHNQGICDALREQTCILKTFHERIVAKSEKGSIIGDQVSHYADLICICGIKNKNYALSGFVKKDTKDFF